MSGHTTSYMYDVVCGTHTTSYGDVVCQAHTTSQCTMSYVHTISYVRCTISYVTSSVPVYDIVCFDLHIVYDIVCFDLHIVHDIAYDIVCDVHSIEIRSWVQGVQIAGTIAQAQVFAWQCIHSGIGRPTRGRQSRAIAAAHCTLPPQAASGW
jgi:hypothetical protein